MVCLSVRVRSKEKEKKKEREREREIAREREIMRKGKHLCFKWVELKKVPHSLESFIVVFLPYGLFL